MRENKILKLFLDTLFPPQCVSCKKKLEEKEIALCSACKSTIEVESGFLCSYCRKRFYKPTYLCHPKEGILLGAAAHFEIPAIRELIHKFKYNHNTASGEELSKIMISYLEKLEKNSEFRANDFVCVPIPLHLKKERVRGFNQAESFLNILNSQIQIAHPEWEKLNIDTTLLKRIKPTYSQTECKNYKERRQNISESFKVLNTESVKGKSILLFDDVSTSGATLLEAKLTLQNAGARRILALVSATV